MGEATSDFLVHKYNPFVAVAIGAIALAIALTIQFKASSYVAWKYWLAVAMVAVFGTMAADALHIKLGIPYIYSTIFYAVALILIFVTWHKYEKTLSIHSIYTKRREFFYWLAVLATFAMGTAAGDMTATTLGLGYFSSGLLFIVIFAIPALAYWLFKINAVFAFWFAYIMTRPLGASFADWFGVPKRLGGLNLGRGIVSISLSLIIIAIVVYLSKSHKDVQGVG
jgi:uncharacterized membrane-anchored protein